MADELLICGYIATLDHHWSISLYTHIQNMSNWERISEIVLFKLLFNNNIQIFMIMYDSGYIGEMIDMTLGCNSAKKGTKSSFSLLVLCK